MRTVNMTNKKNIYCSHCEHCDFSVRKNCRKHDKETNYWQRCKDFEWRHEYIEDMERKCQEEYIKQLDYDYSAHY